MVIIHWRIFCVIVSFFRRFCPSVFFYLCTVIPSVWFLELDLAEKRSKSNVIPAYGLNASTSTKITSDMDDALPVRDSNLRERFFIVVIGMF